MHQGYGVFQWSEGISYRAHRLAWFLATGVWPDKLVLHRCDVRLCVRKSHLFTGTYTDNNRDMERKGRSNHFRDKLGRFKTKEQ